jgi:hypothetical protein
MPMPDKEGPEGFWTSALKVAGLAAIALFVMYELYDHYLELGTLAKLTPEQSFIISLTLIAVIFVVAVSGMAIWYIDNQGARKTKLGLARISSRKVEAGIEIDIPDGWTFRQAAIGIAKSAKSTVSFLKFKDSELNTKLRSQSLAAKDVATILKRIGDIALEPIAPYSVEKEDGHFRLVILEGS